MGGEPLIRPNFVCRFAKALDRVCLNLDHLVKQQRRYGYTVFLSINITRFNLEDVRLLTEFGRGLAIATAYHLCEPVDGRLPFEARDIPRVKNLLDYVAACRGAENISAARGDRSVCPHPCCGDFL
jgi:hypothetical protein